MRELKEAIRHWARTPIITAVVVASLALGIGANTAIFSLIDGLLLKPLPVRYAERLVRIHNGNYNNHSIPTFEQLRDGPPIFESVAAVSLMRPDVSSTSERRSGQGLAVSGAFFDTIGVAPALGRLIGPGDDRTGVSEPVAVLEYHYWQSAYGGQSDVIGKTISLDGKPFSIVGVTQRGFFGPNAGRRFDVAVSLAGYLFLYPGSNRVQANSISIIGRLRDGQSLASAQAEARARQPQIRTALSAEKLPQLGVPWELVPMPTGMSTPAQERYQRPLRILMVLVAIVLLIACVNVANLMLARAAARRSELAVMLSLGASRAQVIRTALIESLVVAFAGAALGVAVGLWIARAIVDAIAVNQSGPLATWIEVALDWRMLAFATSAGLLTAILFGTGPAWRSSRIDPLDAMRQRTRTTVGGGSRIAQALVVAQVGLAFVLLFGGAILVRSFIAMTSQDLGFDSRQVTVAVPDFSRSLVKRSARVPTAERIRQQLAAQPGIDAIALVESSPYGIGEGNVPIIVPGSSATENVVGNRVGDGFFRMIGMQLRSGRNFLPLGQESPTAAIVNEAFANRYFAGSNPVGQTVRVQNKARPQVEIVGVVADARAFSLREPVRPTLFIPFLLTDEPWIEIDIRSRNAETAVKDAVLATAKVIAPSIGVEFRSMDTGIQYAAARDRVVAWLAGGFAILALLLAAIGLYGVMSHQVIRRRQEFGVRVAIGAQPGSVTTMILRQAVVIVSIGLLIGIAGAMASGRLIAALLYDVTPADPLSIAIAAIFLSAITMLAGLIPARRAARVDPMIALREE